MNLGHFKLFALLALTVIAAISSVAQRRSVDYSHFSHATHVGQQKLNCSACHKVPTANWKQVRKADNAFPDVAEFPQHDSCLNCHRRQFFARERPAPAICANCHVQVTPRNTVRYRFPSLGYTGAGELRANMVSEFQVYFPHEKHQDVVTVDKEPNNCSACHQTHQPQGNAGDEYLVAAPKDLGERYWIKKGTFKTIPATHEYCFTCHSAESEIAPLPSDCSACHKSGAIAVKEVDADAALLTTMHLNDPLVARAFARRASAATFRHEVHTDIVCGACHLVASMNTLDARTLKVPVKSCGGADGCHVTATTDDGGILNYEIDQRKTNPGFACTKCHLRFGKQSLPVTHDPRTIQTKK